MTILGGFNWHELPPDPRREHWRTIHRAKATWTEIITYLPEARRIPYATRGEHRHTHITFERPGPESDHDNAASRCKVILDALVRVGLLHDDNPKHCTLHVATRSSRTTRTIVTLSTD